MPANFVTIVPHIENLELRKDTGQIPYHAYRHLGFNSTLVSYYYTLIGGRKEGPVVPPNSPEEIAVNYPYLQTEVAGLKIHFLQNKGRGKFYERAIYEFIKKEARNIDILNLFHFNSQNIFYILIYKLKNPKGKVYLKLDIDIAFYEQQKSIFNVNGRLGLLKGFFYTYLLLPFVFTKIDLISAEHNKGLAYFSKRFRIKSNKLKLIPNGVDIERIMSLVDRLKPFEEKDNIILTVGRIGNIQKNHELLLHTIPKLDLSDWKFYFAGPIEKEFQPVIDSFFVKNPSLIHKIIFTGNIESPSELYALYNKAKIFCMPSRWEGFPLAAAEAAIFGCVLVLSEAIYAFETLTENGNWGVRVNDLNLEATLKALIDDQEQQKLISTGISNYARKTFVWKNIVTDIHKALSLNKCKEKKR